MEIPVTISAFNKGMLVAPRKIVRLFLRIALIPIAAIVPRIVEMTAAARVIWIVVMKADMIVSLWKQLTYHLNVNPPQDTLDLELLNDKKIDTTIGK